MELSTGFRPCMCSSRLRKTHRKSPVLELILIKLQNFYFQATTFIKKETQHSCFLVSLTKSLFFIEQLRWTATTKWSITLHFFFKRMKRCCKKWQWVSSTFYLNGLQSRRCFNFNWTYNIGYSCHFLHVYKNEKFFAKGKRFCYAA